MLPHLNSINISTKLKAIHFISEKFKESVFEITILLTNPE